MLKMQNKIKKNQRVKVLLKLNKTTIIDQNKARAKQGIKKQNTAIIVQNKAKSNKQVKERRKKEKELNISEKIQNKADKPNNSSRTGQCYNCYP